MVFRIRRDEGRYELLLLLLLLPLLVLLPPVVPGETGNNPWYLGYGEMRGGVMYLTRGQAQYEDD